MPTVSVIIPTYNRADMVSDAIESVIAQSCADWELIVVDDGSTDNTPQVVGAFNDTRIKYLYQPNKGLPGARNTGIRASSGACVAFLDSDDLFLPGKLQQQAAFLAAHPDVGLVAGGHIEVDRTLRPLRKVEPWHGQPELGVEQWLLGCPFITCSVLVRRSWLDMVGLFDEDMRYVEDWDLWLRLAAAGCPMAWLREPVCLYRFHGSNTVRNVRPMQAGLLRMLDKFYVQPDLNEEALRLRRPAYANAYLNAAARAYAAGAVEDGRTWLSAAFELDPTLLAGDPPRFLNSLASFALIPLVEDGPAFMTAVVRNLPAVYDIRAWSLRRANSLYRTVAAFDAYQRGDYRRVTANAFAALIADPRWLRNRGLLAITGRALFRSLRGAC